MPSETKELIAWKRSECPICTHSDGCSEKIADLRVCFYTDRNLCGAESIKYLILRTIRFICAKKNKYSRKQVIVGTPFTGKHIKPTAVLYCANRSEFTRCRQLT